MVDFVVTAKSSGSSTTRHQDRIRRSKYNEILKYR